MGVLVELMEVAFFLMVQEHLHWLLILDSSTKLQRAETLGDTSANNAGNTLSAHFLHLLVRNKHPKGLACWALSSPSIQRGPPQCSQQHHPVSLSRFCHQDAPA